MVHVLLNKLPKYSTSSNQISTVKAASTDAAVISLKVAQVASTTPKEAVRTIDKAEKLAKKIADNVTKDEDTAKDAHGDFGKIRRVVV